jgi:hypothetical protein
MKIEKIHLSEKTHPVTIDQKEKMVLWGKVANTCMTKPYDTNEKFYSCLDAESRKRLS